MKQRVTVLEAQLQQLADEAVQQRELKLLIGQLEEFVVKVQQNLASADWAMKREIIRALVRRVEIDKQEVTVVFRVGPDPFGQHPEKQSSQHCWRRVLPRPVEYGARWTRRPSTDGFPTLCVEEWETSRPQSQHDSLRR
jgi:site-specific DNA recombinase